MTLLSSCGGILKITVLPTVILADCWLANRHLADFNSANSYFCKLSFGQ
jgi:hypothetical protein